MFCYILNATTGRRKSTPKIKIQKLVLSPLAAAYLISTEVYVVSQYFPAADISGFELCHGSRTDEQWLKNGTQPSIHPPTSTMILDCMSGTICESKIEFSALTPANAKKVSGLVFIIVPIHDGNLQFMSLLAACRPVTVCL